MKAKRMSEYTFMGELKKKLECGGVNDVVRIETGGTRVGVPDMFVNICRQGYRHSTWIECKLDTLVSINDKKIKVNWGPGQQAFMIGYANANTTEYRCVGMTMRYGWTALRCRDGVLLIPMYKVYEDNIVDTDSRGIIKIADDKWNKLSGDELVRELWYCGCISLVRFKVGSTKLYYLEMYTEMYGRALMHGYYDDAVRKELKEYVAEFYNDLDKVLSLDDVKELEQELVFRSRALVGINTEMYVRPPHLGDWVVTAD